jgi:pimeloyl-ACP methyl ester carboxylesterase
MPDLATLEVNGTPLEYFERGAGTPVIFVHGAPSDCRMWEAHCAALAPHYRAVAYTQRHFGRSGREHAQGPPFGVWTHANDLAALVAALAAGPAHIVAWSYGGHVALTAATLEPHRFKSLFIYEPGVPTYVADAAELATIDEDAALMFGPVFAAVEAGDLEAAVQSLLDGSGRAAGYFATQPKARRDVQLDNAHVLPRLLRQEPPPALTCEQLRALEVPIAVAWGEHTRPLFGIVARAAARCLGGERHAQVPGANHMWPEERPGEFTALVRRFLSAL